MSELAPATLEGWYALHQMFRVDWPSLRTLSRPERDRLISETRTLFAPLPERDHGWSAAFNLVGGGADWMFVHFRRTLDDLARADGLLRRSTLGELIMSTYDYLSITEAGLYHATAEAAAEAKPGTAEYQQLLDDAAAAERASPHIRSRLYPEVQDGMRYISFYPMTKRRSHPDNWYSLPVAERNRLMREHGMTGRKYGGRVFQVITGSVGFDDWEWGVTLFARDPLEFKRIVTEMRYDEASTRYGEFGEFFTGIRIEDADWQDMLEADSL
jgi:hydrogen peroxide-dependent heme synthase